MGRFEIGSYCSKVNRFIPSFKKTDLESLFYFDWNLFLKNNAHWNLSGVLLFYSLFYLFNFMQILGNSVPNRGF
jgi:hypothetical protein